MGMICQKRPLCRGPLSVFHIDSLLARRRQQHRPPDTFEKLSDHRASFASHRRQRQIYFPFVPDLFVYCAFARRYMAKAMKSRRPTMHISGSRAVSDSSRT